MSNFIIKLLDTNQKNYNKAKRMLVSGDKENFIVNNLGLIMLLFNVLTCVGLSLLLIITLPALIIMMIINAPYCLYQYSFKITYFRNKYIKKHLISFEQSLNKEYTYYLAHHIESGDYENKCKDIKNFILTFFLKINNVYETYESKDHNFICAPKKRRTVHDMYLICKYYYPEVTLKDVLCILIDLVDEGSLAVSKCSDIKKYVFTVKNSYTGVYINKELDFMPKINFKELAEYYGRKL